MNREFEAEAGKSPETIEREIDAQRASIGHIVDALESKFTPGQMFDQALGMMQSNGTTFLTNLGTSVRNNPVPAVLTSVGLLWLMVSQNRPPTARAGYRVGPDQNTASEWADGLADGIDGARDRLNQAGDSLKDGYQSLKDKAASTGDRLGAATENLSHAAHDAGEKLRRNTQVAGQQLTHLLQEQPLMVAAAGIAFGALLGAALPSTTVERRYLGKTSADLADKVKHQAQEGFEAVRDTVTRTTEHTDPEAKPQTEPRVNPASPGNPADLSQGLGTS